jgi:hypothetical protein
MTGFLVRPSVRAVALLLVVSIATGCAAPYEQAPDEDKFVAAAPAVPLGLVLFSALVVAGVIVWSQEQRAYTTESSGPWILWIVAIANELVRYAFDNGDTRSPEDIVADAPSDTWQALEQGENAAQAREETAGRMGTLAIENVIDRSVGFSRDDEEGSECFKATSNSSSTLPEVNFQVSAHAVGANTAAGRAQTLCFATRFILGVDGQECFPPLVEQTPRDEKCESGFIEVDAGGKHFEFKLY